MRLIRAHIFTTSWEVAKGSSPVWAMQKDNSHHLGAQGGRPLGKELDNSHVSYMITRLTHNSMHTTANTRSIVT